MVYVFPSSKQPKSWQRSRWWGMAGAGQLCHPTSSPWKRSLWSFSKCGAVCKQIVWETGRRALSLIPFWPPSTLKWSLGQHSCHWVCGLGYPLTPAQTVPCSHLPKSQAVNKSSFQIIFTCTFLTHSRPPLWLWGMTKKSLCAVPERNKQYSWIPHQPVYKNSERQGTGMPQVKPILEITSSWTTWGLYVLKLGGTYTNGGSGFSWLCRAQRIPLHVSTWMVPPWWNTPSQLRKYIQQEEQSMLKHSCSLVTPVSLPAAYIGLLMTLRNQAALHIRIPMAHIHLLQLIGWAVRPAPGAKGSTEPKQGLSRASTPW